VESDPEAPVVSRRAFLAGAMIVGAPAAVTAADLLSPGGAGASEEDPAVGMFVGTVTAKPSADAVDCQATGSEARVHFEIRAASSRGRPLSDFDAGDTVVAVDARASRDSADTRVASGLIPCVIGKREDVVR
jgi:hypothetical protein